MFLMAIKKPIEFILLICSLTAVAAINYTIIHNPFVFIMTFLLLIHELGHYFSAKRNNVKSMLPFFIPIPLFPIGVTITENSDEKSRKYISISGAFTTSLSIVILMFFNFYYKIFSYYILLITLIGEVFFNYIGLDGQKYRGNLFNKKIHSNQHIETRFSKEPLWKLVMKSPRPKNKLEIPLNTN